MTNKKNREIVGFSALETAADWLDRQDELSAAEQREFTGWLRASAEHARAYALLRQTMHDAALLDAGRLAKDKPADRAENSLMAQVAHKVSQASEFLRAGGWVWLAAGAVAAVLLVVVFGGFLARSVAPAQAVEFATALRQRADFPLADRSHVFLNADSKVSVVYSDRARDLRLERGEAIFEVTRDSHRPFNVAALGDTVTAVGTVFGVDLMDDAVEVRVFKGVVKVASAGAPVRLVHKGQWLVLDPQRGARAGSFDPATYQGWRSNWLEADNMPLSYVVAKLNRYTDTKIVVADKALSNVGLTGRFQLSNTDATLAMIGALLNTTAARRDHHVYLMRGAADRAASQKFQNIDSAPRVPDRRHGLSPSLAAARGAPRAGFPTTRG